MYVRESCKDSFDSVRVPYARFGRGRLSESSCPRVIHWHFFVPIAISSRLVRYDRDLPIYADPRTHQTIIYARGGGEATSVSLRLNVISSSSLLFASDGQRTKKVVFSRLAVSRWLCKFLEERNSSVQIPINR